MQDVPHHEMRLRCRYRILRGPFDWHQRILLPLLQHGLRVLSGERANIYPRSGGSPLLRNQAGLGAVCGPWLELSEHALAVLAPEPEELDQTEVETEVRTRISLACLEQGRC